MKYFKIIKNKKGSLGYWVQGEDENNELFAIWFFLSEFEDSDKVQELREWLASSETKTGSNEVYAWKVDGKIEIENNLEDGYVAISPENFAKMIDDWEVIVNKRPQETWGIWDGERVTFEVIKK